VVIYLKLMLNVSKVPQYVVCMSLAHSMVILTF